MANSQDPQINEFPQIFQIEVSSFCNFNCKMCVQHSWHEEPQHISLPLFEKIAQILFPRLKKVILYGLGEPLMHPEFLQLLTITRRYLPENGLIDFTTNGSLLDRNLAEQILSFKINRIIVSLDAANLPKLRTIRSGATDLVFKNLEDLGSLRKEGKFTELGIETVIMRSNYHDLPNLVEFCAQIGIDTIFGSHLLPHTEDLQQDVLYFTTSEESWKYSEEICKTGWNIVSNTLFNVNEYGFVNPWSPLRKSIEKAYSEGIGFNPPLIYDNFQRISFMEDIKRIFSNSEEYANKLGVKILLPRIIPKVTERKCPFMEHKAVMIKANGDVAPCYNFLHDQCVFINKHEQKDKAISFGNLNQDSFDSIWNSKIYQDLRKRLAKCNEKIPWCGDCSYSTHNCFYVKSNDSDCLGNQPGCHECLYSTEIVRCLF
jgi:MoaA/NifB/PqqE/SkfB family radical SAM enzyme